MYEKEYLEKFLTKTMFERVDTVQKSFQPHHRLQAWNLLK